MVIGVSLSGGGVAGAAHIGFMLGLAERGISPAVLAGTSAGGIVGGFLASGISVTTMDAMFAGICAHPEFYGLLTEAGDIVMHHRLTDERGGLIDLAHLFGHLLQHAPRPLVADWPLVFGVSATDIVAGQSVLIAAGSPPHRGLSLRGLSGWAAVTATSAIPGIFSGIAFPGGYLADGGILDNAPWDMVQDLADQGGIALDRIISVEIDAPSAPFRPTPANVVRRTVSLLLDRANIPHPVSTPVVHVVPQLPPDAGLFSFSLYGALVEAGREAAAALTILA